MRTSNLHFLIITLACILFACKDNNDIELDANDAFVGSQRLITLSSEMDKFSGTDFECVIKAEDGTIFRRRGNHMRSGNTSLLTLDTGLRTGTYRLLALEVPTIENGTDTVWTDYGLGCRVRISAENHSATVLDTFNSEFELVGDGSETDPFIISSAEHLWRLRDFTNSDENNTKLTGKTHFRQECDLRMRDICTSSDRKFGWLPIGSIPENPFRGIYDGNGYKITGLWIHRPNSPGIGLFGFIDQAKISNLTVQNPDIEGNYAVGALVGGTSAPGDKRGSSALHGCTVEGGSVSAPTGSVAVGGLIGVVDRKGFLSVDSCYNNNTRVSGDYAVGGLVGAGTLYSTINALACNNHGRITARYSGAGGIVGSVDSLFVSGCRNMSAITGGTAAMSGTTDNGGIGAGGIAGGTGVAFIYSSFNEGKIEGAIGVGGIIGYATGELTISNSSIMAFVAGEDAIGGAVGLFKDGSLTISKFYNAKVDKNKRGDESRSYMPFSVTASANNAGGLVGRVDGSTTNISISDVTMVRSVQAEDGNLKAVSVVGENAGGLIGGLFNFKSCQFRNVSLNFPVYGGDSTGGLAGYTSMGGDMSIENCRFFSVASGNNSVGGLFGTIRGHSHSIVVEGSDDGTSVKQDANSLVKISGKLNVGGFAGHIDDTKLAGKRIYINAPVSATDTNAGCAIGNVTNATVNLSLFNISKYAKATGPQNIGGMVGSADNSTLTGSLNIGTLSNYTSIPKASTFTPTFSGFAGTSGITKNVGGIVGYIKNSFVTNLCFAGTVEGCNNVGGIIGLADNIDKGYVRGCVNNSPKIDNKISDSTGGIIGRLNQFDCATCENLINYGEISGANYTGGIIGDIHEEGKAKNFYLKNAVNVGKVTGTGQVGGCVGHYWASGILNLGIETIHYILYCANYGEVNGSNGGNVGGIIGYFNARKAVVSHSANHGKVYGSGSDVKVGGIAGRMGSNDEAGTALPNNMELSYSCNFGEVGSNTGNANVGGLLGWQEQGSPDDETHYMLHNCYNMGIVPTNQDSDNGGVLGCIDHLGEVQNCYNAKKVSHGNGIIGTHKGGSIFYHHNLYVLEDSGKYWCADKFKESDKSKESTYKGFDFKSVWAVSTSTNNGFPYLRDCPYQFKKLE